MPIILPRQHRHLHEILRMYQSRYPDGAQKDWRVVKKHLLTLDPSFQSVTPNALRMKFTRGKSKSQSACQSATVPMATTNVGASAVAVRLPPAAPAAVTGISSLVGIDIVPQIAPGDACVPPIAPEETVDATMTGTAEAVIMPTIAAEPSIPKKRIHHENSNQLSKKRKSEACDSCKRAKGNFSNKFRFSLALFLEVYIAGAIRLQSAAGGLHRRTPELCSGSRIRPVPYPPARCESPYSFKLLKILRISSLVEEALFLRRTILQTRQTEWPIPDDLFPENTSSSQLFCWFMLNANGRY
ncbi:hypothetical protein BDR26DRAFT_977029 [Obelidium mucronatum]|nr:hypothetical protein BDR26DRAFT_977029 [Obelidium mucronatum]